MVRSGREATPWAHGTVPLSANKGVNFLGGEDQDDNVGVDCVHGGGVRCAKHDHGGGYPLAGAGRCVPYPLVGKHNTVCKPRLLASAKTDPPFADKGINCGEMQGAIFRREIGATQLRLWGGCRFSLKRLAPAFRLVNPPKHSRPQESSSPKGGLKAGLRFAFAKVVS